jgi:sulfide:quinone oxidoreductase
MVSNRARPKIVVLGGGFGGLESALYMRMKMPREADITLISDQEYFLFKPNTIYIPFGLDPNKLKFPLAPATARKHVEFKQARVQEVDPISKLVHAEGPQGQTREPYDYLVVATGASMRAGEVAGLQEFAYTIWTPTEMMKLRAGLRKLVKAAQEGERQRVLFLVPPNNKCSGPLYEMVMMLDTWLRRRKVRKEVSITWTTFEESYIQAFGPRLHEVVKGEFEVRGIKGHNQYVVDYIDENVVAYNNGEHIPYDLLVSFPPYVASTSYTNLPTDERGFIGTELRSRRVQGYPEVFAVGDAGDFPVKQAFLAFLQADAAAEHLSAEVVGRTPEVDFDPVSMCVMEEFDTATFAQVPLHLTGRPEKPIEVRSDPASQSMYKVGTSPVWRLGKKMLGYYLPWRFKGGNPFHAGLPWRGMEAGLKVMSNILAR